MRALALMALTLVLAGHSVSAGTFKDRDGSEWNLPVAPGRYVNTPYSGPGEMRLNFMSRSDVNAVCENATGKAAQAGCAILWSFACEIYIADDLPPLFRNAVRLHEEAHCKGWPADHPVD